jgi:thiamine biosynthesis protein ThiS
VTRENPATDAPIELSVNGEPRRVPTGCTVARLVEELVGEPGAGGRKVAVAVNREVVPRSRFAEHVLGAGDRVEILEAVGGG